MFSITRSKSFADKLSIKRAKILENRNMKSSTPAGFDTHGRIRTTCILPADLGSYVNRCKTATTLEFESQRSRRPLTLGSPVAFKKIYQNPNFAILEIAKRWKETFPTEAPENDTFAGNEPIILPEPISSLRFSLFQSDGPA